MRFNMPYCTEWEVSDSYSSDMFGGIPLPRKDKTIKGYLHILAPREGADVRPASTNSNVIQGGAYMYGTFITPFTEDTLAIGCTLASVASGLNPDFDGLRFVVQDIVKEEVNPFTGWQPTKKYMVACWRG